MHAIKVLSYSLLSFSSLILATAATTDAPTSTITSLSPAQFSKIVSDIATLATALTANPSISYYVAAADSAAGTATDLLAVPTNTNTNSTLPEWFTKMPSDAQSFWSSAAGAAQTIISKDAYGNAPRPTGVIAVAGAAAAGVLGVAALL